MARTRALIDGHGVIVEEFSGPSGLTDEGSAMQIILSDLMSLDGIVQAPGGSVSSQVTKQPVSPT